MRIIAGKWKGKRLYSPEGNDIRPTSDRTREALFNLLMHTEGSPVIDAMVVDLCCGSGALGLEALSRGAAFCTFIDNGMQALKLVARNIDAVGARRDSKILQANVSALPAAPAPAALIFMDPPYQHAGLVAQAYASLCAQGWLREGTLLSIEHSSKMPLPALENTELVTHRRYGKSEITLLRINAQASV